MKKFFNFKLLVTKNQHFEYKTGDIRRSGLVLYYIPTTFLKNNLCHSLILGYFTELVYKSITERNVSKLYYV